MGNLVENIGMIGFIISFIAYLLIIFVYVFKGKKKQIKQITIIYFTMIVFFLSTKIPDMFDEDSEENIHNDVLSDKGLMSFEDGNSIYSIVEIKGSIKQYEIPTFIKDDGYVTVIEYNMDLKNGLDLEILPILYLNNELVIFKIIENNIILERKIFNEPTNYITIKYNDNSYIKINRRSKNK